MLSTCSSSTLQNVYFFTGGDLLFEIHNILHFDVLSSYKKAIGKDYKRLTFYLIALDEVQETYDDSSTEEWAKEEKSGFPLSRNHYL